MKKTKESDQEFYGEGSFGCVFRPSPECTGREKYIVKPSLKTKNEVAKIFIDKDEYLVEKNAASTLLKADNTGNTILLPYSGCRTDYKNVLSVPVTSECHELNKMKAIYGDTGKLYMLKMPFGGSTLDKYVRTNNLTIKQFMNTLLPVFDAIARIRKIKYCHQDIKSTNILVRTEGEMKDKGWLIDYSLIETLNDIYKSPNRRRIRHSYFPYPPEYKLFSYIQDNEEKIREKEDCKPFEKVLENILHFGSHRTKTYFKYHDRIETHKTILDLYKLMSNSYGENIKDFKKWMTANAAPKVDVYSLGMVLIDMDHILDRQGISDRYLKQYSDFVTKCTHPDFRKRYTAQGAYRMAKILADNK